MHYHTNTIRVLEINPSADLSDTIYTIRYNLGLRYDTKMLRTREDTHHVNVNERETSTFHNADSKISNRMHDRFFLFLDSEGVPDRYKRCSLTSCSWCYQIFETLRLCQYATDRN